MLQYLDFSHASTSRKWGHKRQGDGLEAPRNSMEFALEASHSYGVFQEDVPYSYSCNMRQYPKSGLHISNPVKKLIQKDISFRTNEGQKKPGVIARLMGMESPPLNEITPRPTMPRRGESPSEMISTNKHVSFVQHHSNRDSTTKQAPKQEIIRAYGGYGEERDVFGQQMNKQRSNEWSKPQPREHPQEEELQRFKKEFEAWQASRAWEQSRSFELESTSLDDDDDHSRCTDIVPYRYQHHQFHNGKAATACHGSKHMHFSKSNEDVHWRRSSKQENSTSISGSRTFSLTTNADAAAACSTRLPLSRFYHEEEEEEEEEERPSLLSPTRIVILKPCPELSTDDVEESSLLGSPELVKKENNMEAFLEEVKKRLKIDLEGGVASDDKKQAADRRWGDIVPQAADPKQIARSIANQIRENVMTRDIPMHPALLRSESTRSYRSDVPPFDHGQGGRQMDYIGRDARRQLSDRLKNVLRRDPADAAETPFSFYHRRRATTFDEEPRPMKPTRHEVAPPPPRKGKVRTNKEEKKRAHAVESDVRSFRYGSNNTPTMTTTTTQAAESDEPVSPRNLMRSFSAPVSGTTSFVKLLSEEPRVLTGARLQRKQEGHGHGSSSRPPPASSEEEKERKGRKEKDAFSIRGKVSNLRQNLGLRAKLFGKKLHASDEPLFPDDLPPIGILITAPSVLIHPGILQENSTEVPPSPASWCSSPPEPDEMSRGGGYPSPVSPLEASFSEHRSPLTLRTEEAKDMASTAAASEPGMLSEQVLQTEEEERTETSPVLDDQDYDADHPTKSFVRALLVVAGMYGRRQNHGDAAAVSEYCEATKPVVPKWVLEEVVSSSASSDGGAADVDHRLLFDLVNEALPGAVRASTTLCAFDKCHAIRRAPGGKALLEALWKSLQVWLEPPPSDRRTSSSASVDVLIGRDLSVSPWHGAFREDADALAGDVEAEMLDELLDETVWDVLLNVGD